MTENRAYVNAAAFRAALEHRLQNIARAEGEDLEHLRRCVAFDRMLARLFADHSPWVLKGGFALELRLGRAARVTRDIDLGVSSPASLGQEGLAGLPAALRGAAARDLGDWFEFTIGRPVSGAQAAPAGGGRFPAEARVDGRRFVEFHLDVGVGDTLVDSGERVAGRGYLRFAGIDPAFPVVISLEQQFAEKLHAYTLPRIHGPNTRVRDLIDMVLMVQRGFPNLDVVAKAVSGTFAERGTHQPPATILEPDEFWRKEYHDMAVEIGLTPDDLEAGLSVVRAFWQSIQPIPRRS